MKTVTKCPKCGRRRMRKGLETYRCRKCRHTWKPKSETDKENAVN